MELKHLEYFVTCVRAGSFTKAADILYINQSSISRAIQTLEEEWETTLFLRSKRGAFLTIEGQEYYNKVEQILLDLDGLGGNNNPINNQYVTFASFPSNFLSSVYAHFCMKHKEEKIIFRHLSRSTSEILRLLSEHLADVGFIYSSEAQQGKLSRILQKENLTYIPLCNALPCLYIGKDAYHNHSGKWTVEDVKKQSFFKTHYDFKETYHDLSNTIAHYSLEKKLAQAMVVDDGYGIFQFLNHSDYCYLGHFWLDRDQTIITNPGNKTVYTQYIVLDSYDGPITLGYVIRKDQPLSPYVLDFIHTIPSCLHGNFFI